MGVRESFIIIFLYKTFEKLEQGDTSEDKNILNFSGYANDESMQIAVFEEALFMRRLEHENIMSINFISGTQNYSIALV